MLETIAQATPWGFASILVILIAAIVALSLIANLLLKVAKAYKEVKVGSFQLRRGAEDEQRSPHASCPHSADILEVARKTAELRVKVNNVHKEVLKEQMQQAQEKIDEAVHIMQHQFIKLINEATKGTIPFIQHRDYALFELIRDAISPIILSYIRYRFEDNHYAFYSPEAQLEYITERKHVIIRKVTELLTQYWCCTDVSRMAMTAKNREVLNQYDTLITSIFNEAFSLAREGFKKIQQAENDYRSFIEVVTGERDSANAIIQAQDKGRIQV